jgi:hypothetical protein
MGCHFKPAPISPKPIGGPPPQNPKYTKRWLVESKKALPKKTQYERDYQKALAKLDKEINTGGA